MECKIERQIGQDELCKILGKERTTIYRWRKKGKFPEPIKDPGGNLMWRESTINNWFCDLESQQRNL